MTRHMLNVFPALLALSLVGCSSQPSGTGSDGTPPESVVPVDGVHRAITLSYHGEMDAAISLLLDGEESDATNVEPLRCLSVSEWDYRLLIGDELETVKNENQKAADTARALARAAVEKVQAARAAGNAEQADAWLARIDAMGRELTKERYNALLQLIGPAIVKTAAKEKGL